MKYFRKYLTLSLFVLLLFIALPVKAEVANKDAVLCGGNGAVESIASASYLPLESRYSVKFSSVVSGVDENGNAHYEGTLANAFYFTTSNNNSFYQLYFANPEFSTPVTFQLYDSSKILCTYSKANVTLSQSTGDYCTYKLKPNSVYYVVVSASNGKDYTPSTASVTLRELVDDAGDVNNSSVPVEFNTGYEQQLDGFNDVDYYSFTTDNSKCFYSITYSGKDLSESKLEVFTPSLEKIVDLSVGQNMENSAIMSLDSNKRYYIKVSSSSEFTTGSYYFLVSKTLDDVKDDPSVATKLNLNTQYTYGLQSSIDRDAFSFNTGNYTAYNVELTNNDPNTSNYVNLEIQDVNGRGAGSVTSAGWSTNSVEMYNLKANTVYYIFVKGEATLGKTYNLKISNITRNITYNLNKGKNNSKNGKTYKVGGKTKLYSPTRTNYKFLGWYTTGDFIDGTQITEITADYCDDIEIYAKWEKISVNYLKKMSVQNVKGRKAKVTITKVSGAKGYQLDYSTSKKFPKKLTKSVTFKGKTKTVSKLKKGKTYYFRVRPYVKNGSAYCYGKGKTVKLKIKK